MSLADAMDRFLICSRELYNIHFRAPDPWSDPPGAWDMRDRFEPVRCDLFRAFVTAPNDLDAIGYGVVHPQIAVLGRREGEASILLNREVGRTSGYWDHPSAPLTSAAQLRFVCFFDWSEIERADYRYVMVKVVDWPGASDAVGRYGLVDTYLVTFERAGSAAPSSLETR